MLLCWPKDGALKSQHPIRLRVRVVGGDKLPQINERKTHPLMEDGGESRVIKNMKMNKFWEAVLGSSQQLQSCSLHLT